ncbi:MAG: hypothetical protein DRH56_10585 [Deltaproteobacteria bacterium]|nr:MAG: hypothetical protein DRH56_10585 [Deltaproteobacteria bacterium]
MYQHKRFITLMTICALAILATAALLSLAGSGRGLTVQAAPASPTVNTISSDTTWGPGVVTITSDVVITNGATLVVKPGTTVIVGTWAVPTDTAPYVGGVSDRVEIIVANGRLVADGYVTATQLITPYQTITFTNGTLGDPPWWGIRILHASAAVSESIVSFARIEWGTYGISIDNASPTVTHNCITNMNGAWGSNGENGPAGTDGADGTASTNATDGTPGGDGSPGGNGSPAYGIYVTGANSAPLIAHNEINDVTGGQGGWGGSGGKGGKGGDGYSPTDPNVGDGGDGARGAAGGDGAPGGDGGDAAGIYVQDASPTIYHNTITKIRPGNAAWGGSGGNGGAGGKPFYPSFLRPPPALSG